MIVLIDNYDSFTYNIYHYILHFRDDVVVVRNTENINNLKSIKNIEGIVLSPGPSHPKNSNLTIDAIDYFKAKVPIFGVCLGMQAIGYYFGGTIRRASVVMHGKTDKIEHKDSTILKNMSNPMSVVRYHSLVVDRLEGFDISASSLSDKEVMAVENDGLKIYGVQFHPESYLTQNGMDIIKNFLGVVYD